MTLKSTFKVVQSFILHPPSQKVRAELISHGNKFIYFCFSGHAIFILRFPFDEQICFLKVIKYGNYDTFNTLYSMEAGRTNSKSLIYLSMIAIVELTHHIKWIFRTM